MILPDVNLLVYAYNAADVRHAAAREWWESSLSGTDTIALAWAAVLGYVRIVTNRRALVLPIRPEVAVGHARAWLERPQVQLVNPGARHLDIFEALTAASGASGALTTDVHFAALAIEHQAELHSTDGDFKRFPGLRWRNPLA